MRVLVVEDDQALGLFLQKGLRLQGHSVDWVGDGVGSVQVPLFSPWWLVAFYGAWLMTYRRSVVQP